jgi:hypothetical protein
MILKHLTDAFALLKPRIFELRLLKGKKGKLILKNLDKIQQLKLNTRDSSKDDSGKYALDFSVSLIHLLGSLCQGRNNITIKE